MSKTVNMNNGITMDRKGRITDFNADKFTEYFLTKVKIAVLQADKIKDNIYYCYSIKENLWEKMNENDINKKLEIIFNRKVKYQWNESYFKKCMFALASRSMNAEKLKESKNYINCKNGLLNLETLSLEPHNPDVFSVTQIPIKYNPKAKAPRFKKFLEEIFEDNQELINFIQEIMGYALTTSTQGEIVAFFHGTGRNGKSTLLKIIRALLGEKNVSSIALEDFSDKFKLSEIDGKLANIADESRPDIKMDTSILKRISSGNYIQIDQKYKQVYSIKPNTTLFFSFNTLPDTDDTTISWKERMKIIPFKFEPEIKNPNLYDDLHEELNGILNFAIRGLKRLRLNGYKFSYCEAVEKEKIAYFAKNDIYERLLNECVEVVGGKNSWKENKIYKKDMYKAIIGIAKDVGNKELKSKFYDDVTNKIQNTLKERGIYKYIEPKKCYSHHKAYFPCVKFTKKGIDILENVYKQNALY
jgi:P4 family phage/plasmid primase-like protien